jgi:hypothetical protein
MALKRPNARPPTIDPTIMPVEDLAVEALCPSVAGVCVAAFNGEKLSEAYGVSGMFWLF